MPCLLIYGDTGMGKTKILRKFLRDHPPRFNGETGMTSAPIAAMQMPAEPLESDFYESVARRSRFWLSRAWRSRAIEVDIAIWTIDLATIGCSG